MTYDVIVLGLGAMGSAAAQHLAERGKHVLGIEQFTAAHDQGSSHGGSRMIRQAYFESPDYIPLVLRAYELWRRIEKDTGADLLHITGGLNIGSRDGELVRRTIAASEMHSIPFEVLEGRAISGRFPVVVPLHDDVAVHETNAGYLFPEECIRAQLALAARAGAGLHFEERVLSWDARGDGVEVRTDKGAYTAGHLVITAGPWASAALQRIFPLAGDAAGHGVDSADDWSDAVFARQISGVSLRRPRGRISRIWFSGNRRAIGWDQGGYSRQRCGVYS